MPYATALTSVAGGTLEMCNQNCMRFFNRIAYDREYHGLVEDPKARKHASKPRVPLTPDRTPNI